MVQASANNLWICIKIKKKKTVIWGPQIDILESKETTNGKLPKILEVVIIQNSGF